MEFTKSNKFYFAMVLVAFAVVLGLRLVNLHSDSPFGVSTGLEFSTDPPQYISFADNYQLSRFKCAAIAEFENSPDSAKALLVEFETPPPGVMSCQLLRMRMSLEQRDLKGAISYLKGALNIDKENAVAQGMPGDMYL